MDLDRVVVRAVAPRAEERSAIVDRAWHRGFTRFVGAAGEVRDQGAWMIAEEGRLRPARPGGGPTVAEMTVGGPEELAEARRRLRHGEVLELRFSEERVLPLEALVADPAAAPRLWVRAAHPEELPAALGALEHGAAAVVVDIARPDELDRVEAGLDRGPAATIDWIPAVVRRVDPVGLGDRILVDTTSLLAPDEGLLVGSAAAFLVQLRSETIGSRFTRPRAFRVNAGAAHSYVLLANGETRYLSELEAGDRLRTARPDGSSRAVRVGRIKIERRPLSLVEFASTERSATVFVQEAETVRFTTSDGAGIAVTALRPGAEVLATRQVAGRHLGLPAEETVVER
jgi:3-dehydroquinate synthase II